MLLLVHLFTGFQGPILGHFLIFWVVCVASSLLGLAISAAVDSSDKAVLLMIVVVIPQILFGNAIIELTGLSKILAVLAIVCYWGHDGIKSMFPDVFPAGTPFRGMPAPFGGNGLVLFGDNGWLVDWIVLLLYCAIYGSLAYAFLRKKDGPTGKPFAMPLLEKGTWVEVSHRL